AVIVAPGGGFRSLSMENEGWDVARALAERGVAAFVLKYRLNQTPRDLQEFARPAQPAGSPPTPPARPSPDQAADCRTARVGDARAAFGWVRSRAAAWKVGTARIGMSGCSAGAMLTMATARADRQAAPAFVGDIYGPLSAVEVPA